MPSREFDPDQIEVLSIPMKFGFRGLATRELVLFQGAQRWAEWSPFVEYEDDVATRWLRASLEWADANLPTPRRSQVEINATLPILEPAELSELLSQFSGCRYIKLKVGGSQTQLAQELARIEYVQSLRPEAQLRLDANGTWSISQTIAAVERLLALNIKLDYLEQPVKDLAQLGELRSELKRKGLAVRIAVDESLRTSPENLNGLLELSPDVLVVKVAPLGGIIQALALEDQFPEAQIVVSSALETSIGLQSSLLLAATLKREPGACGIGTALLLAGDSVQDSLLAQEGEMKLPESPLQPSSSKIMQYRVDNQRRAWWLERLKRCLERIQSPL